MKRTTTRKRRERRKRVNNKQHFRCAIRASARRAGMKHVCAEKGSGVVIEKREKTNPYTNAYLAHLSQLQGSARLKRTQFWTHDRNSVDEHG